MPALRLSRPEEDLANPAAWDQDVSMDEFEVSLTRIAEILSVFVTTFLDDPMAKIYGSMNEVLEL